MVFLIANIILIIVEGFVCSALFPTPRQRKKSFLLIAFIQLFVIHAFLDPDVMQDLPGYYETYEMFGENSLQESSLVGYVGVKMEPGWIVLCRVLYQISSNPRLLLIVTSILMVGGYCKTISRYSPISWLSIVIYLCTTFDQSMIVLRQHSAIALTLLAIPFILERDLKRYLFIMTLAFLIHSTSIIFIPMYFIYGINMKKYWLYFFTIAIVGTIVAGTVFPWLFSHTWYNSYDNREASNYTLFFVSLSSLFLYLVSIKFKISDLKGIDKYSILLISMAVLLCLCGVGYSPTNRMVKYFSVASIILIPRAINKFKDDVAKVSIIIVVVLFHLLLFLSPSNTEYFKDYRLIFF